MIQKLLLKIVISFVVRQLDKFHDSIDWAKVKADAQKRIADVLPGEFFDDEGKAVVVWVVDRLENVLGAEDRFKDLLKLIAEKKLGEAAELVKDILLGAAFPVSAPVVPADFVEMDFRIKDMA